MSIHTIQLVVDLRNLRIWRIVIPLAGELRDGILESRRDIERNRKKRHDAFRRRVVVLWNYQLNANAIREQPAPL